MATEVEIGGGEVIGGELDTGALSAYVHAEIDVQIATAKKYPRSIKKFKQSAMALACLDEETAATMFYVLPRDGKKIEGPSVRLAEIVGSSWGNLRYGARVISMDDRFLTAQGACHDLETNNAATVEIRRRITKKDGKRYSDDMIQTTANAACSIALRQAIFKIVPFALVKDIYSSAKATSVGKADSMANKRLKALDWFKKAGADDKQVLAFLAKPSIDDIDLDDLIVLRGLVTAIKDGETTIEDALAVKPKNGSKVGESDLNSKLNAEPPGDAGESEASGLSSSPAESQDAPSGSPSKTSALSFSENDQLDYQTALADAPDKDGVWAVFDQHVKQSKGDADIKWLRDMAQHRADELTPKKPKGKRGQGSLPMGEAAVQE